MCGARNFVSPLRKYNAWMCTFDKAQDTKGKIDAFLTTERRRHGGNDCSRESL